jgi:hypothetical protein
MEIRSMARHTRISLHIAAALLAGLTTLSATAQSSNTGSGNEHWLSEIGPARDPQGARLARRKTQAARLQHQVVRISGRPAIA